MLTTILFASQNDHLNEEHFYLTFKIYTIFIYYIYKTKRNKNKKFAWSKIKTIAYKMYKYIIPEKKNPGHIYTYTCMVNKEI